jgi:ribose 5-phosphate isomerase A
MRDLFKRRAAERALEFVVDGQVIGLGTGSTARFAIEGIGAMAKAGMNLRGVPTSIATQRLAVEAGVPLADLNEVQVIDLTIDGADEVDPNLNMIKGGGGALTREKLVALASRDRVFIVDEPKLVERLGSTRSVPVEVLPFSWSLSAKLLGDLGCDPVLRRAAEGIFVTDNGNFIIDCGFGPIDDAAVLEKKVRLVPGVLECGLFIGVADKVVIAREDHVDIWYRNTVG